MSARGDISLATSVLRSKGDGWTTATDVAKELHANSRRRPTYANLPEREREDLLNRARSALNGMGLETKGRGLYRLPLNRR